MARSSRTAVLYARCDPGLHRALLRVAQRRRTSVGALLRDAAQAVVDAGDAVGPIVRSLRPPPRP